MADREGDGGGKSGGGSALLQIVLAIITVTGVISTAVFANWDKIFGHANQPLPQPVPVASGTPAPQPTSAPPSSSPVQPGPSPMGDGDGGNEGGQHGASSAPSGIWYDANGASYQVRQQGGQIALQEYMNGILVGSGSGTIQGRDMRFGYASANGDQGQCTTRMSEQGDEISGRCQSVTGMFLPFMITR